VGKRGPIAKVGDVKPSAAIPAIPEGMSEDAVKFWNAQVPKLFKLGAINDVDVPQLQNLCEMWAMLVGLRAAYAKEKPGTKTAVYMASVVGGTQKQFSAIASKFGMTTGDRARLPLEKPPAPTIQRRVRR
jgi:phage terminase small subunit